MLLRQPNVSVREVQVGYPRAVLRELSQVLGIFHEPITAAAPQQGAIVNELMKLFIELRADARKNKNFALADQIRQRLGQLGITLEDRPGGTGWRME